MSPKSVNNAVEQALKKIPQVQVSGSAPGQVHLTPRLGKVLNQAEAEMKELRDEYLSVEHVLLAMVEEGGVFQTLGLKRDKAVSWSPACTRQSACDEPRSRRDVPVIGESMAVI